MNMGGACSSQGPHAGRRSADPRHRFALTEKLPIGSRQGRMLEKLLTDLDSRNPGDELGCSHVIYFFAQPTPAGPTRGTISEISPVATTSSPSSAAFGNASLAPAVPLSPWPLSLAGVLEGELSTLGAPLESWLLDEESLGFGSTTDGSRPSPGLSYFFAPATPSDRA